ncbi:MAG TPA: hypothetical protein VND87_10360 [Stellaceae bacterium]|nr:hypothetical protein [Stellaceae bacterium]
MTEAVLWLAGREFAIRPLTLGQLRHVLDVIGDLPGKSGGALVEAAARIIEAGLARSDPAIDLAAVLAMEASLDEVNRAVAAILRLAGLGLEEAKPGEAAPVATAEPSSPASTAPSPPAADIPIR